MAVELKRIYIDNFKSYDQAQWINISDLNIFMGANSSGKSTALQTLLTIKQTVECNSSDIDLLLSGKFVTLGDFNDVVNDPKKEYIQLGVEVEYPSELGGKKDTTQIKWKFRNNGEINNNAELVELFFLTNKEVISLYRRDDGLYGFKVNDKETHLLLKINNLVLGNLYVEYDEKLNLLFQQFLNELLMTLLKTKKVGQISKTEMVSISGVEKFYISLMQSKVGIKTQVNDEKKTVVYEIMSLIDKYVETQFDSYYKLDSMPKILKEGVLSILIDDETEEYLNNVKSVLSEYANKLEEYINVYEKSENKKVKYSRIYSDMQMHGNRNKNGANSAAEDITNASIIYRDFLKEIISNIFYVGPIREKPQGLYNIGFESVPKYVGTTGAYFASVLLRENKIKEYILPDKEKEKISLGEALDVWVSHLNVANEINVEQKNSFGFSVSVENMQNKISDIMNVGIGTSQVLPVLISGLLSEKNEILMFEQPELHLHPFSQSRLADFFVMLSRNGRKVFVETHSEYMILRLRYHVLVGNILEGQISINFFQNKNGTKVRKGTINSYGNLEYPEDFKDETQELLNSIIAAAITKGKQDDKKRVD